MICPDAVIDSGRRQHRDENYNNRREQIIKTISEMDSHESDRIQTVCMEYP